MNIQFIWEARAPNQLTMMSSDSDMSMSIIESKEDIKQILRQQNYIHHAHTGNPGMEVLGGIYEKEHRFIASALRKAKYLDYLTAEILNNEGLQEKKFLSEVIEVMREYYE